MSLAVSIPPIYTEDLRVLKFVLRNITESNAHSPDLTFEGSEFVQENERVKIWRGTLSPGRDGPPVQVVCKFAYGENALERVAKETRLYFGKLKDLQDIWIPHSYGYFIGDTYEGPTGCLVLDYCGEPLSRMLEYAEPPFRDAVVDAVNAIHKAGVEHLDLDACNILDHNGHPIIIDFEEAQDHVCERGLPMVRGATEPSRDDFNCPELYQLCSDSNFWKPGYIIYATAYYDIELAKDAHKLAAEAPPNWPHDFALQKAYHAIIEHAKLWYPGQYEAWLARIASQKTAMPSASDNAPMTDSAPLTAAPIDSPADGC